MPTSSVLQPAFYHLHRTDSRRTGPSGSFFRKSPSNVPLSFAGDRSSCKCQATHHPQCVLSEHITWHITCHSLFYGFVLALLCWRSTSWQILHFVPFKKGSSTRHFMNSVTVIKDTRRLFSFLLEPWLLLAHTEHLTALQIFWQDLLPLMCGEKDLIHSASASVKPFSELLICLTSFLNLTSQTLWGCAFFLSIWKQRHFLEAVSVLVVLYTGLLLSIPDWFGHCEACLLSGTPLFRVSRIPKVFHQFPHHLQIFYISCCSYFLN